MMAESNVASFLKARDYIAKNIELMMHTYMAGEWNPAIEVTVIRELNNIVNKELKERFPELSIHLLPRYLCRVVREKNKDEAKIELNLQQYMNKEKGLAFLGNYNRRGASYDLYCAPSWDGVNEFIFYARYGHLSDNYIAGASEARSEYYSGIMSPLSIAYGMAVHDRYING